MAQQHKFDGDKLPASEVWILAASTGGLKAVSQFLSNVRPAESIGFVYAQHIEAEQTEQLVKMIERRSPWRAELAGTNGFVAAGHVAVISPEKKTRIGRDRLFLAPEEPWRGNYRPNIDNICADVAASYQHCSGMIVFTGMGDDGVAGSFAIKASGGSVWVQAPATCVASALPELVVSRGAYDFIADIDELSCRFNLRLNDDSKRVNKL